MRFAKLALTSLAVAAAAAIGVSAFAQQPATPPAVPPAVTPVEPAPTATPAPETVVPAPVPAPVVVAPVAAAEHGAEETSEEHAAGGGEHHLLEPKGGWPHEGLFGTLDANAMQRGFKVYKEVCSTCHGLKLLSFRNLGEPGGPFHDARFPNPNDNPAVKKLASEFMVPAIDPDSGGSVSIPGRPSDPFPSPFANAIAAAVGNGGAVPPDLSVIAKARHGGAAYIYSLLLGFEAPPSGLRVNPGQHYNKYFPGDTASQWENRDPRAKPPGGFLAMSPPLQENDIRLQRTCAAGADGKPTAGGQACDPGSFNANTFDDGKPTTREQQAHDVAVFLAWASDPKQVARKQLGAAVIPFMFLLALLVFLSYRRLWRNVEH